MKRDDTAVPGQLDMVWVYHRQLIELLVGLSLIGLVGQSIAAALTDAAMGITLLINCISLASLMMILVLLRRQHACGKPVLFATVTLAGNVTAQGFFLLNNGIDGTHIYPVLWLYSLVAGVGLIGSWMLTSFVIASGVGTVVIAKLAYPDLFFGAHTDQTWARVSAMNAWWVVALLAATTTGRHVVSMIQGTMQARQAVLAAQVKQHALAADTERLRLGAATERADTLTDLARAFDARVRWMVEGVARVSTGIGEQATTLSHAAAGTGERVGLAAEFSLSMAQDTAQVTLNAGGLGDSLTQVRDQAQAAAAAAAGATAQVCQSSDAIRGLANAVARVGKAISLISAIADRTDLLALSATIESARAGEAGHGFAVVAVEVKGLARRSAQAADEISRLVRDMGSAGNSAAAALGGIGRAIDAVSRYAGEVGTASLQQASAVEAIMRASAGLTDKTDQVLSQMSEMAQLAEATSVDAAAMLSAAGALEQDAGSLQDKAGAFIARVRAA